MEKQSFSSLRNNKKINLISLFVFLLILALMVCNVIFLYLNNYFRGGILAHVFIWLVFLCYLLFAYPQLLGLSTTIYTLIKKKRVFCNTDKISSRIISNENKYKIALLYITKDDFIPKAALMSSKQTWKGLDLFILDDSVTQQYIEMIDNFVLDNPQFKLVRRCGVGSKNKSGNVNYFLDKYISSYTNIVFCDSDTYLDSNFVVESIKYFDAFDDIGIVQGSLRYVNCFNAFQDICTPSYTKNKLFWSCDSVAFSEKLTFFCVGHGCMLSTNALKSIGSKLPDTLTEDRMTTVEMLKNKFFTIAAPEAIAFDENPPSLISFKKRQLRWAAGDVQFTKKELFRIWKTKIPFYLKMYIIYTGLMTWFVPFFTVISTILFYCIIYQSSAFNQIPIFSYAMSLILIMLTFTTVCTKPKIIRESFISSIKILLSSACINVCFFPSSILSSLFTFFKSKPFNVTIKKQEKYKYVWIFKDFWFDILIWLGLFTFIFVVVALKGGLWWLSLLNPMLWTLFISFVSLFILPVVSNKKITPQHCEGFDSNKR